MLRPTLFALALAAAPVAAQEAPPALPPDSGMSLIERGAGILLDNLMRDLKPQMEDAARGLGGALAKYGPAFEQLSALMDDIRYYSLPERLPNGDILLRRLPGAPPPPPIGDALRDLTTPRPSPAPEAAPAPSPAPLVVPQGPQIDL